MPGHHMICYGVDVAPAWPGSLSHPVVRYKFTGATAA
jgi:hypothetical protein